VKHYTLERNCGAVTEKTFKLSYFVPVKKSVKESQRENIEIMKMQKDNIIFEKSCVNKKTVNESQEHKICDKL